MQKAEQLEDFGCLLVSFLKTFGKEFNFYEDAVSIRRGGICHKSDVINAGVVDRKNYEVNFNRRQNDGDPPWERLVVEDYFTGHDFYLVFFAITMQSYTASLCIL